jgi:hypothetical protein
MQAESATYFKTLSKAARTRVDDYSSGDGAKLNTLLYRLGKKWVSSPKAAMIKTLDDVIEKTPRLLSAAFFFKGDDARHWSDWKIETEKQPDGFFSTAGVYKRITEGYATAKLYDGKKPVMVIIKTPAGAKGLYIGDETAYIKSYATYCLRLL